MNRRINGSLAFMVIGASVIFVCGCSPKVAVKSNLSSDFRADLEKVYVVLDFIKLDEATQRFVPPADKFSNGTATKTCFSDKFIEELRNDFDSINVEAQFYKVTGVELTDIYLREDAKKYHMHEILWIRPSFVAVENTSGLFGLMDSTTVNGIVLDVRIRQPGPEEQLAWRAMIDVESRHGNWEKLAREAASALVDQLIEDGLVEQPNRSQ